MTNRQSIKTSTGNLQSNSLLLKLYKAYNGEIELISDYLYFSIIVSEYDTEASRIFEEIATEKIQSFKLLGELLKSKGVDPSINATIKNTGTGQSQAAEDIRIDSSLIKSISEMLTMYENNLIKILSEAKGLSDSESKKIIMHVCDMGQKHVSVLGQIKV